MRMKAWSLFGPGAAIGLSLGFYFWVRTKASLDVVLHHETGHFYIVSLVSLLALLLSIAVAIAGIRLRNVNVTFLALAYISLAGVFAVHGLSTPGFLVHDVYTLPKITAQLSVLLASVWIWLSTLPTDHAAVRALARWQQMLLPLWAAALVVFGVFALVYPSLVEALPIGLGPYKWPAAGVTTAICLSAMFRYRESYMLTRFPLHIGIVYSSGLLIVSQLIMITGSSWQLSWWLYHIFLLVSMLIVVIGVIRQYLSLQTIGSMLVVLFKPDPRAWIASCISPGVKELINETESKDAYTAGHNFRVALYGLRLAEEMGVGAVQLRAMAQGGIVHDVGKLRVPDEVLNKPGRLTQEERRIIEEHPMHGYNLCKRLGFMGEELSIIRSHHEKWDGTGYPDGLQGTEIPLLARIIAVADVYDALTSTRAYRTAMTHEEAMAVLKQERGKHFDPMCIDGWLRLCDHDPHFIKSIREKPAAQASAMRAANS